MAWQEGTSIPGLRTTASNGGSSPAPPAPQPNQNEQPANQTNQVGRASIPVNPLDPGNPYYVHPSENPSTGLVLQILTGENYYSWERAMRMALLSKNKLAFVNGVIEMPLKTDENFGAWERANNLVLSWIYHSVNPGIAQSILWIESAAKVWHNLQERFGIGDVFRISDLMEDIYHVTQGGSSIAEFYNQMQLLWDELFNLRALPTCVCNPKCSCGVIDRIKQQISDDQVARFLKGLNSTYAGIRSQIMLMNPLPNMNKACSMVQAQERQMYPHTTQHQDFINSVVNGPPYRVPNSGNAAASIFLTKAAQSGNGPQSGNGYPRRNNNKRNMVCTYCGLTGHTEEKCYKKHGYPPGYKGKGKVAGNANMVQLEAPNIVKAPQITYEQYERLMYMLGQEGQNSHSPSPFANTGSPSFANVGAFEANHNGNPQVNLISTGNHSDKNIRATQQGHTILEDDWYS